MKRIDHGKFKLEEDHRLFKEFQRANSNWGKKVVNTATPTSDLNQNLCQGQGQSQGQRTEPIPGANTRARTTNATCSRHMQSKSISSTIANSGKKPQGDSLSAKPSWNFATRTRPSEIKSPSSLSVRTIRSRPSPAPVKSLVKIFHRNSTAKQPNLVTRRIEASSQDEIGRPPVTRSMEIRQEQEITQADDEQLARLPALNQDTMAVEFRQNQSGEALDESNSNEGFANSTQSSVVEMVPSQINAENHGGALEDNTSESNYELDSIAATSATSTEQNVEVLNMPDLPVDKPTFDPRLQVPNKIEFVKENGLNKGTFIIKNVSNVNMTYRVYTTNSLLLSTNPEMGVLGPDEEVSFNVECDTKLYPEKVAVFGFPIYFSRQLNKNAVELLWKSFRTANFPEKCAEEHNLILVPARWSKLNDYYIFRLLTSIRLFGQEEKPLDWVGHGASELDIIEFKSIWNKENYAMKLLQFDNEEMNWTRHLEKVKDAEKMRQDRKMCTVCAIFVVLMIILYALIKIFVPGWMDSDLIDTSKTTDYRSHAGWFYDLTNWLRKDKSKSD